MSENDARYLAPAIHVAETLRLRVARSLLKAPVMRLLMFLVLVGCGHGSGGGDPDDPCTDPILQFGQCPAGLQCTYPSEDGGRDTSCDCQGGFFVCNSCDSSFLPPAGACTPGDACEWNTWEHGCSCGCGSDGQWSCLPQTIGTTECGPRDAGV